MELTFFVERGSSFDFDFTKVRVLANGYGVLFDQLQHGEKSHDSLVFVPGFQQTGKTDSSGFPDEVHKEFGYTNSYPLINTGWDGTLDYENRYEDFTIPGTYNTRELANTIPVMVTKKGKDEELINILLTAEQGKVASKVCVGRDYEWCRERQDIDDKFHKADGTKLFQQYVIKNLGDDWYQLRGK